MRNVPGWVVGALGVGVVAGAFFLGGRLAASDLTGTSASGLAPVASVEYDGPRVVPESYTTTTARPAVVSGSARTSTVRRAPVSRNRSTKKSVAIIAGSTAAGALVGGLVKGKKGAIIGGLVGGGAATIWDQATRRKKAGR